MSTSSSGSGRHQCTHCPMAFSKPAHLLRHTRSHISDKPFGCSSCDKSFSRTDSLQRHERTVHSIKRPRTDSAASEEVDQAVPGHQDNLMPDLNFALSNGWYSQPSDPTPPVGSLDFAASFAGAGQAMPAIMPSSAAEINDMIAEWLAQDGGLELSEFLPPVINNAAEDPPLQPAVNAPPIEEARPELSRPGPPRRSPRGGRRTVVASDIWESGIPASDNDPISRAPSPQRALTSPEQVVGKLNINGPHVSPRVPPRLILGLYDCRGPVGDPINEVPGRVPAPLFPRLSSVLPRDPSTDL